MVGVVIKHGIPCLTGRHIHLRTLQQIRSQLSGYRLRTTGNATIHQGQNLFRVAFHQFLCLGGTEEGSGRSKIAGVYFLISSQSTCIVLLGKQDIAFHLNVNRQRINSYRLTDILQSGIIRPILIRLFRLGQLVRIHHLTYIIICIVLLLSHLQRTVKVVNGFIIPRLVILAFGYMVIRTAEIPVRVVRELSDKIIQEFSIVVSRHLRGSHKQIDQCLVFRFGQSLPDTNASQRRIPQRKGIDLLRHRKSRPCRITSGYRVQSRRLLRNAEHLSFRVHHRTAHHLVFHPHTQCIIMVLSRHFGYLLHLAGNAGDTLLRGIRKHPRITSHCRSSSRHHQRRHFLFSNSYTELYDIIHIIRSQYPADRHLLTVRRHDHRTLRSLEKRKIG